MKMRIIPRHSFKNELKKIKCTQTLRNRLRDAHQFVILGVSSRLQFVVITNVSGCSHQWHLWRSVVLVGVSMEGRWRHVGEQFADVSVVGQVAQGGRWVGGGGGGGLWYGQQRHHPRPHPARTRPSCCTAAAPPQCPSC